MYTAEALGDHKASEGLGCRTDLEVAAAEAVVDAAAAAVLGLADVGRRFQPFPYTPCPGPPRHIRDTRSCLRQRLEILTHTQTGPSKLKIGLVGVNGVTSNCSASTGRLAGCKLLEPSSAAASVWCVLNESLD